MNIVKASWIVAQVLQDYDDLQQIRIYNLTEPTGKRPLTEWPGRPIGQTRTALLLADKLFSSNKISKKSTDDEIIEATKAYIIPMDLSNPTEGERIVATTTRGVAAKPAAKEKKAPKAKAEGAGSRSRVPPLSTIKLLTDKNPKREGTAAFAAFAAYKNGMTVGDYLKKGGNSGALNYDISHKFVEVTIVENPKPEPKPAPAAKAA